MQRKQLSRPPKNNAQIQEYIAAVKRGQKDYYVSVSKDGWNVRSASASRASGRFATKTEAVNRAKELASPEADVVIHGKNGTISILQAKSS